MPLWLVKCSVSPDWSVPAEIVTLAPVRSLPLGLPVSPASTATAAPPSVKVLTAPEGVSVNRGGRHVDLFQGRIAVQAP